MLVDLGRNDVGKVSKLGTVKVTDYLKVQKYSQVMHIGSTVEGEIRNDMDAIDAVDDKILLIESCLNKKIDFISSMGTAKKVDIKKLSGHVTR